jgi:hypothetical protein
MGFLATISHKTTSQESTGELWNWMDDLKITKGKIIEEYLGKKSIF